MAKSIIKYPTAKDVEMTALIGKLEAAEKLADKARTSRYGRNTQISHYKVGGLKNPYNFNETQYFF